MSSNIESFIAGRDVVTWPDVGAKDIHKPLWQGFFSKKYRLQVLAILALCGISSAVTAAEYCAGEAMPTSPATVCALDYGITPDVREDLSTVLENVLLQLSTSHKGVFFPTGSYHFKDSVLLGDYNSLIGSSSGVTLFSSMTAEQLPPMIGDETYSKKVENLSVENIVFNNIYVRFSGNSKENIVIRHNAFINTNHRDEQLSAAHVPYEIQGNVFMRGRNYPGLALSTYANRVIDGRGLLVEGNFLGSPNLKNKASTYVDATTTRLIEKLLELRQEGKLAFDDDQGNFVAGWYATSALKGATFRKNFFAGNTLVKLWNPKTWDSDIGRDHNIYIKEYDDVDVVQNYFSGWPDQASGQLKFRNAQRLVFAANYLDGISFYARPYNNSDHRYMRNTYIFNNQLNQQVVNGKVTDSYFSYWQNFKDTPQDSIQVLDYLVFDNLFTAANKSKCRVTSPTANETLHPGQFFAAGNRYEDGTSVRSCDVMQEVAVEQLKQKLPVEKRALLELKVVQPGPF